VARPLPTSRPYIGRTGRERKPAMGGVRRRGSFPPEKSGDPPMTDAGSFILGPRLAQDGISLGDLPLSRVLMMNDANYPWLILVPRRPNLVELIDLDDSGQATLMIEIARAARAQGRDALRQAQCRGARQYGASAPRARNRPAQRRSGRRGAGMGRGACATLRKRRARAARRHAPRRPWAADVAAAPAAVSRPVGCPV
jgi:hypothetical protein